MVRGGARVLGIDLSQAVLRLAELHALEAKLAVEYRAIAAEELAPQAHAHSICHLHEMSNMFRTGPRRWPALATW